MGEANHKATAEKCMRYRINVDEGALAALLYIGEQLERLADTAEKLLKLQAARGGE